MNFFINTNSLNLTSGRDGLIIGFGGVRFINFPQFMILKN